MTHKTDNFGCLNERHNEGLTVKLWVMYGEVTVTVSGSDNFAINCPADKALDCFYHPYAYKEKRYDCSNAYKGKEDEEV